MNAGFAYNGKTTGNIIGTPLLLASTEQLSSIVGASRSKVEGEITIARPVTNEYGTLHEPLSFNYALLKEDASSFTAVEQIAIERWLISPKHSSQLVVTDCDGNSYMYIGIFLNTEWHVDMNGFFACVFTFQTQGSHAYRHFEHQLLPSSEPGQDTFEINCQSDELEEYVYPMIVAEAVDSDHTSSFRFENVTDGSKSVEVNTNLTFPITLDCRHCRIFSSNKFGEFSQLRFKNVGWADVDNIYWPRLLPGQNTIRIEGNVSMKISYYAPQFIVGGWAV